MLARRQRRWYTKEVIALSLSFFLSAMVILHALDSASWIILTLYTSCGELETQIHPVNQGWLDEHIMWTEVVILIFGTE